MPEPGPGPASTQFKQVATRFTVVFALQSAVMRKVALRLNASRPTERPDRRMMFARWPSRASNSAPKPGQQLASQSRCKWVRHRFCLQTDQVSEEWTYARASTGVTNDRVRAKIDELHASDRGRPRFGGRWPGLAPRQPRRSHRPRRGRHITQCNGAAI